MKLLKNNNLKTAKLLTMETKVVKVEISPDLTRPKKRAALHEIEKELEESPADHTTDEQKESFNTDKVRKENLGQNFGNILQVDSQG